MRLSTLSFLLLLISFGVHAQSCEQGQYLVTLHSRLVQECRDNIWSGSMDFDAFVALANEPVPEQAADEQMDVAAEPPHGSVFTRIGHFFRDLFTGDEDVMTLDESVEGADVPEQGPSATEDQGQQASAVKEETTPATIKQPEASPTKLQETGLPTQDTPEVIPSQCDEKKTASDVDNCGGCGNRCLQKDGTSASCVLGRCTYHCESNYIDLNNDETDGCECAPDEFELNDNLDNAFDLGTLDQAKGLELTVRVPPSDADYFTFYAKDGPDTRFDLQITTDGDAQLCLYQDRQILSCKEDRVSFTERTGLISGEGQYALAVIPNEKSTCEQMVIHVRNS